MKKNPAIDFGFHVIIPRILRTGYKQLTHAQKWLYVCLKDFCGDTGTCYRSLRVLADETDISIGQLSLSIRALHQAGLIHAEKRKRGDFGKEVWHITIADLWQANAEAHPTRQTAAPAFVQNLNDAPEVCSENEQSSEFVQKMNNVVQNMNDLHGVCSENEQRCSKYERCPEKKEALAPLAERPHEIGICGEVITIKQEQNLKARTLKQEREASQKNSSPVCLEEAAASCEPREADASPPPLASSAPLAKKQKQKREGEKKILPPAPQGAVPTRSPRPKRNARADTLIAETPEQQLANEPESVQRIVAEWRGIFKKPIGVTPRLLEQARLLAGFEPEPGEVAACRLWVYRTDRKGWYRDQRGGGMTLADIARNFEAFRAAAEAPRDSSGAILGSRHISSFDDPNYDMSGEFYPSEAELQRQWAAQRAAQKQEVSYAAIV